MAKMKKPVVVDFETAALEDRPRYPPAPVGVAIKRPNRAGRYYAFAHPTKNNCSPAAARDALKEVWEEARRGGAPLLFHNAKFDIDIAETHFNFPALPWEAFHDTLFSLFLWEPHARSLSLKPAAERLLGMAPEERDAVNEWLLEHGFIKSLTQKNAGAFICKAPGDIVGRYAIGDVVRTERLHEHLMPLVEEAGMMEAYDRERRLMRVLLKNEREGMRCDVDRLRADIPAYETALARADDWLRKRLKTPALNVDSDAEVAEALKREGVVTDFVKTPTGRDSVAKKNLTPAMFHDPRVASVLGYRNRMTTVLSMSMRPWLASAESTGGTIHTQWNQVRQSHGDESISGARTGRLSCSRFMNITKDFADKDDGYIHPRFLRALPELPRVRVYVLPDKGEVIFHRDYNQQELRILGHFEDGPLCAAYNDNPKLDIHDHVQALILELLGMDLHRRPVKTLNFGKVYGMGVGAFALRLGVSIEEARKLVNAHRKALPGVAVLEQDIKLRAGQGLPIRTWGGRLYYCEPPMMKNGRLWTFEYKLLNYLIQGSAADCTKEALIRFDADPRRRGRFLVAVHDEVNGSTARKALAGDMAVLREVMASLEFDVPMLSDGKDGPNWGELTKYKEVA